MSAEAPTCPRCGESDQVEESVNPETFDGYCYDCMAPFRLGPPSQWLFWRTVQGAMYPELMRRLGPEGE